MLDALAYMKAARAYQVPAALEVSQSGRGAHVWIFFAQATSAATARGIATSLLGEAFQLRGSMHLSSYDRLFPSQDVHTGRGMGNLIAAPLNGKRRQHGTTLFLDPATLEPFDDQWAYLSSIARLSHKEVATLARSLPDPQFGHRVRRLQLPTSSKIVPRPAAIVRATFASRLTLTANDLRSSHDRGRQTCCLNPQSRVRCPPARSTQHLGHSALSLQLRRDSRRRPRPAARAVHTSGGTDRFSRQYVAHRRRASPRRESRIQLPNRAQDRAGRRLPPTRRRRCQRADRTSRLRQDGDRLRRHRFPCHVDTHPGRPQSPGGPMA